MGSRENWAGLAWVLCFFKASPSLEPEHREHRIQSKNTPTVCDIRALLEPRLMLPVQVCLLWVLYRELLLEPGLVSSLPTKRAFTSASVPLFQPCLLSGTLPSLSISLTLFQSHLL